MGEGEVQLAILPPSGNDDAACMLHRVRRRITRREHKSSVTVLG